MNLIHKNDLKREDETESQVVMVMDGELDIESEMVVVVEEMRSRRSSRRSLASCRLCSGRGLQYLILDFACQVATDTWPALNQAAK